MSQHPSTRLAESEILSAHVTNRTKGVDFISLAKTAKKQSEEATAQSKIASEQYESSLLLDQARLRAYISITDFSLVDPNEAWTNFPKTVSNRFVIVNTGDTPASNVVTRSYLGVMPGQDKSVPDSIRQGLASRQYDRLGAIMAKHGVERKMDEWVEAIAELKQLLEAKQVRISFSTEVLYEDIFRAKHTTILHQYLEDPGGANRWAYCEEGVELS